VEELKGWRGEELMDGTGELGVWGGRVIKGRAGGRRWIWGAVGSGVWLDFDGDYDFSLLIRC